MADALLETKGLGRDFGGTRALNSVDLTLEAGAPVGLVGPNGAGKTTLFSVVCGFLRPTRGTVQVLGSAAAAPGPARPRRHLAAGRGVRQRRAGGQPARDAGGAAGLRARAGAGRGSAGAGDRCCFTDAASKAPETLSHGMLERIAIAQAFMGSPELVLLDEPTAGLDPATASHIKNLIRSLDRQRTFVVARTTSMTSRSCAGRS